MREIKFRGIDKHGNWAYGFLTIGMDSFFIEERHGIPPTMLDPCGDTIVTRDEVEYKTVGQFTGLMGIYEGDILSDHNGIGVVEYSEKWAGFRVNYKNGRCKWFYNYLDSERKSIEIIGNIHENPELLEEK